MSNYNVYYSDPGKTTPIVVVDGTLNQTDTSLKLVGQNYPGYGPALSEDLVHILENFASSSPPNNPIEGQLWFNTSDPLNKKLLVNDGTAYNASWSPVNGVHQQPIAPTNVNVGDIWVDTNQQQVSIWNGSNFILVGPTYAGTSKTGPYATTSTDLTGLSHNIVIDYVNGNAISIVAQEAFTPLQSIDGFPSLKPGVNLTNKNFGTTQTPIFARFNGTANAAQALLQSSSTTPITADAFARSDIAQSFFNQVTFNTDQGILIGTDPTFAIQRQNQYDATFLNTYGARNTSGGRFVFRAIKNNVNSPIVVIDGNSNKVGINTQSPVAELDVAGGLHVLTTATVETLVVQSSKTSIATTGSNALVVNGGVGVGGTLVVTGEHVLVGPLTIGASPITTAVDATSVLNPSQPNTYDIGDSNVYWRNVYATTFTGPGGSASFNGNATSASKISRTSSFGVSGAIESFDANTNAFTTKSFNGLQDVTFNTRATPDFVYLVEGGSTSTTRVSDQLVIYRQAQDSSGVNIPDTGAHGNGTLLKQQKSDFLQDLYFGLIQTGCVIPFAGPTNKLPSFANNPSFPSLNDPARPAWLLCDGSAYDGTLQSSAYYNLYQVIGNLYGGTGPGDFRVPDLRNQGLASNQGTGPYLNYIIKT